MREQTRRNINYTAGRETLLRLALLFNWSEPQLKAAILELIRQLKPTLAEN
jgi:hypothetical protein